MPNRLKVYSEKQMKYLEHMFDRDKILKTYDKVIKPKE